MKTMYRDRRTGELYPADIIDQWGRNGVGDGYGPEPVAFHLLEKEYNDLDPATGQTIKRKYLEVSRGELAREEVSDATASAAEGKFPNLTFGRPFSWRNQTLGGPPAGAGPGV